MSLRRIIVGLVLLNVALVAVGHWAFRRDLATSGGRLRVGMVFDVGGRGDRSFNDGAYAGLTWAERELDIDTATIEPSDNADRESALRQLAAEGRQVVIGVGFIFSRDLDRLARVFPQVLFVGVDYAPDPAAPMAPNLIGLTFREHEGSFLTGALAGLATRSRVVGFVGGMRIPLIQKFEAGYIAGVRHVCPGCEVKSVYAGSEPKAFADPTRGFELATTIVDAGADVIFHAAGKTGDGVLAAVAERGKLAIGVDSDQYDLAPCCVLTSMIKRLDVAVFRTLADAAAGKRQGGLRQYGLAEDGVGVVRDDRGRGLLQPQWLERVDALADEIVMGNIQVPTR